MNDTTTRPEAKDRTAGGFIRNWRKRRKLSQLALSLEAGISQRHVSFVESGRSRPSRDMLLRLSDALRIPPRDRNRLLTAAGFAAQFEERPLDHPDLSAARATIERILAAHAPFPALAIDRHYTLVLANDAVATFMAGADPRLLEPPVNVLRLSLHPDGIASRILNFREWRMHILHRLDQQIAASVDPALIDLRDELAAYPVPGGALPYRQPETDPLAGIAVPLEFAGPAGVLSFLSTSTVFGSPIDITLSELAIETFFPADEKTADALRHPPS